MLYRIGAAALAAGAKKLIVMSMSFAALIASVVLACSFSSERTDRGAITLIGSRQPALAEYSVSISTVTPRSSIESEEIEPCSPCSHLPHNAFFARLFRGLSRACLGKLIVSSVKMAKGELSTPHRAEDVAVGMFVKHLALREGSGGVAIDLRNRRLVDRVDDRVVYLCVASARTSTEIRCGVM
jgi:hypothetical protein